MAIALSARSASSGSSTSSGNDSGTSIAFSASTRAPSDWASLQAIASISSSIGPACFIGTTMTPYGTSVISGGGTAGVL